VQTFLPYPSYAESARVLDYRRLGKQRVETKQILLAMNKTTGGWRNHPATKMWRGHKRELAQYGLVMCREWQSRGYKDSLEPFFQLVMDNCESLGMELSPPAWLGDESIHASHRSNLIRKDPAHYAQFGWSEGPDLPYVWPVE
jgi:hypothetical protein